jgi:hypothetical protein
LPFGSIVFTFTMTITSTASTNGNGNGHRSSQGQPTVIQMLREADAAERSQLATQNASAPAVLAKPAVHGFSSEQIAALSAPLSRNQISSRKQGRGQVAYLKSFVVLNAANRIFGFDGWQRQTLSCRCVAQAERLIGDDHKPGWGVTYIARVRITVAAGSQGLLIREGTGAGHGIDTDLGLAHESAIKEAETDAMKRALVTFGNPFGLALYDKSQRQVRGAAPAQGQSEPRAMQTRGGQPRPAAPVPRPTPQPQRPQLSGNPATQRPLPSASQGPQRPQPQPAAQHQTQASQRPAAPSAAPVWRSSQASNPIAAAFNGQPRGQRQPSGNQATALQQPQTNTTTPPDAPLDRTAIAALLEQLKALAPGHKEVFARAFRTAFQVPQDTPSVAPLILQERHRIWIEEFLAKAARG